ncbi:MAG: cupin domain-containing protein [Chloroflexi bacterium]|nr:cupin domain-containing protein [Chloroflexota bacterium]
MSRQPTVTRWGSTNPPSHDHLDAVFGDEDLAPSWWSSGPGDTYATHSHPYHKVLYCARGSIQFTIELSSERIELTPGDRLDIPPGTVHSAIVGPNGVECIEAAKP